MNPFPACYSIYFQKILNLIDGLLDLDKNVTDCNDELGIDELFNILVLKVVKILCLILVSRFDLGY